MKTSIYWLGGMIIAVLVIVVLYLTANHNEEIIDPVVLENPTHATSTSPSENEEVFEGTIQAYDTACFADGVCSVTIDGKNVVLVMGFRDDRAVGKLLGVDSIGDLESKIGAKAKVYALKIDATHYTMYGNANYYVRVETKAATQPTTPPAQGKCYVGGCSSQLCTDRPDAISTCEYTERYACYKTATCERQATGKCGWTETPVLTTCLASH